MRTRGTILYFMENTLSVVHYNITTNAKTGIDYSLLQISDAHSKITTNANKKLLLATTAKATQSSASSKLDK